MLFPEILRQNLPSSLYNKLGLNEISEDVISHSQFHILLSYYVPKNSQERNNVMHKNLLPDSYKSLKIIAHEKEFYKILSEEDKNILNQFHTCDHFRLFEFKYPIQFIFRYLNAYLLKSQLPTYFLFNCQKVPAMQLEKLLSEYFSNCENTSSYHDSTSIYSYTNSYIEPFY